MGYLRCHSVVTCSALSRHVCQLLHCLSVWPGRPLSGADYKALLGEESKHQAELQPLPHAEPCVGSGGKIIPHTKKNKKTQRFCCCPSCGQKSEKQAGMREGLVMAELEADLECGDRSVQLVLIPAHAYNCFCCFQEPLFAMCSKTGMLAQHCTA